MTASYIIQHRSGKYVARKHLAGSDSNRLSSDINDAQIFGTLPSVTGWLSGEYKYATPWNLFWKEEIDQYGVDGTVGVHEVAIIRAKKVEFPAKALRKLVEKE